MRQIKFTFALVLFLLITFQSSLACICYFSPPPCYAYDQYNAVFVGTVKEIKTDEGFRQKITIEVDKNYKGIISNVVFSETGGTSCDFEGYKVNKKLLIYGTLYDDDDKFFGTSYCSHTKVFSEDLSDLEYLNSLKNPIPNYWIWGSFTKIPEDKSYYGQQPLRGVQAQVFDGKNKLVGLSDEKGNLKLSVSKEGIYKVRVFPPKGTMINDSELVNSPFKDKLNTLKARNFGKSNFFIEYQVEVKANKCGWFYLPLRKYEKE
ncbi:MAG TPA: hypothetical protein VNB22_15690 [Pyrinomonadaceae bacterium]|nr:hypothetical protein [Pyrinomonadaceae bacterium]